jgi:hypothetical protein
MAAISPIPCPGCASPLSPEATVCPKCGHPMRTAKAARSSKLNIYLGTAMATLGVTGYLVLGLPEILIFSLLGSVGVVIGILERK